MAVPIAEATMFERMHQANKAPKMKCSPTNGVNDIAAPHAKPAEIEYTDPGKRLIRIIQNLNSLFQPIDGHIKFKITFETGFFFLR